MFNPPSSEPRRKEADDKSSFKVKAFRCNVESEIFEGRRGGTLPVPASAPDGVTCCFPEASSDPSVAAAISTSTSLAEAAAAARAFSASSSRILFSSLVRSR